MTEQVFDIKIEQKSLDTILETLMLKKVFQYVPLEVKVEKGNVSLLSYQENENRSIFRYGRYFKDNFKYIKEENSKIFINAEKMHKVIAKAGPEDIIHAFKEGNKLVVEMPTSTVELNLIDNAAGTCEGLPFSLNKEGIVIFGSTGALENIITIPSSIIKDAVSFGSVLGTEIYQFILDDKRKLNIMVGNLEENSEKATLTPATTVAKYTSPVNSILSIGVGEIASVFSSDITMQLKTNYPVWFSEEDHKHRLGVLLAPRIEKQEGD